MVFVPSTGLQTATLGWVDRSGVWQFLDLPTAPQSEPRLSPDGTQLAYTALQPDADVWVADLARRTSRPLTKGGQNAWPLWSPDGRRVAFASFRLGSVSTFLINVEGSGAEELATEKGFPTAWMPDGKILAVRVVDKLHLLSLPGRNDSRFRDGKAFETDLAFAPDGMWAAWSSNESGRFEVFVQAFPSSGKRWQVSTSGGREPVWNPNGRELFFRNGNDMMAVDVQFEPAFDAGPPHRLFTSAGFAGAGNRASFNVSPDGKRFVMVKLSDAPPPRVDIILNWRTLLAEQVRSH